MIVKLPSKSVAVPVEGFDFNTTVAPMMGSPVFESITCPLILCWAKAAEAKPKMRINRNNFFMIVWLVKCCKVTIASFGRCNTDVETNDNHVDF